MFTKNCYDSLNLCDLVVPFSIMLIKNMFKCQYI